MGLGATLLLGFSWTQLSAWLLPCPPHFPASSPDNATPPTPIYAPKPQPQLCLQETSAKCRQPPLRADEPSRREAASGGPRPGILLKTRRWWMAEPPELRCRVQTESQMAGLQIAGEGPPLGLLPGWWRGQGSRNPNTCWLRQQPFPILLFHFQQVDFICFAHACMVSILFSWQRHESYIFFSPCFRSLKV